MGIFKRIATTRFQNEVSTCLIGGLALVFLTVVCYRLRFNVATAGFLYVIVVVLLSCIGGLVSSIVISIIAVVCLAHLAPPRYSFRVDDPLDVVAIITFLITSLVISFLVSKLRKMTDVALSSINRRLIDSEERGRARIARELHDDIGQRLALLAVELDELQQNSDNFPAEIRTRMGELSTHTLEIVKDTQSLSHELHSAKLEYLGLAAAVRGFCKEFGQRQKVEVDFRTHDLPSSLPPDISLALFRVMQEALQNSLKHSGARHSEVDLFGTKGAIHLIVRDSGVGFDLGAAMKGGGLGLVSMQERMRLVRGEFSIDSQPKRGTTIQAKVPLASGRSPARKVA